MSNIQNIKLEKGQSICFDYIDASITFQNVDDNSISCTKVTCFEIGKEMEFLLNKIQYLKKQNIRLI